MFDQMEERLATDMMSRMKAKQDRGLVEEIQKKNEKSKNTLRNLLKKQTQKYGETVIVNGEIKVRPLVETIDSVQTEMISAVKPTAHMERGDAQNEHEPSGLVWTPVEQAQIDQIYPDPGHGAVSDRNQLVQAAKQQPGVSFSAPAGNDKMGTGLLLKADNRGQLFAAVPDNKKTTFTNPGLNPDGDGDQDDTGTAVPQTNRNSPSPIIGEQVLALKEQIAHLEEAIGTITDLLIKMDKKMRLSESRIEEKMNKKLEDVGLTDSNRTVVERLLKMAAEIRSGSNLDQAFDKTKEIKDEKTTKVAKKKVFNMLSSPSIGNVLQEQLYEAYTSSGNSDYVSLREDIASKL